jgi:hypothetical protein
MNQIKPRSAQADPNAPKPTYISLKKQPDGFTFYGKYRSTYKGKNVETGGDKFTHYFESAKGEVGINGTAQLDDCISQTTPGAYLSVIKTGTAKSKNGRTVVQVQVFSLTPEEYAEKTGTPKLPF